MKKRDTKLVYTSDPEEAKRLRESAKMPEAKDTPPAKQTIRVGVDRKRRKGKTVTMAIGFQLTPASLDSLARKLKQRCASGGSSGNGEIEIQGDHVQRIRETLEAEGYRVKV